MFFETIQFIIALGIVGVIIGWFFYKTYLVLRNKPNPSQWQRVQATVLASRVTDTFSRGKKGLELQLEYSVNGTRYNGTGETILLPGEQPPTTVELVYKPESPGAWEWAEDHADLDGIPSETRFAILFVWFLLILIGGSVIIVIYFPSILS